MFRRRIPLFVSAWSHASDGLPPAALVLAALPAAVAFGSLAPLPVGPMHATIADTLAATLVLLTVRDAWLRRRMVGILYPMRVFTLSPEARHARLSLRSPGGPPFSITTEDRHSCLSGPADHRLSPKGILTPNRRKPVLLPSHCRRDVPPVAAAPSGAKPPGAEHEPRRAVGARVCAGSGAYRRVPVYVLYGSLVVLVALMALSSAWAADRVLALKETIKWGEALAVLVCAPRWLRERRTLALVLGAVVAVAVLEALIGLAQGTIFALDLPVSADRGVRVIGTFGQPNPYSGELNLALPLVLALAAWAREWRMRLVGMGLGVVIGGALALAQSRGALLGLVGALLVLAWLGWPRIRPWLAGCAALAATILGMLLAAGKLTGASLLAHLGWRPLTDAALSTNITDANFSTVERLAHWAAALRMLAAHPLLGVGAGNYPVAYPHYQVPRWHLALGHAHNLYLNMAAEIGIPGALAYLAFVAAGIWLAASRTTRPLPSRHSNPAPPLRMEQRRQHMPTLSQINALHPTLSALPSPSANGEGPGVGPLLLGCLGILIAVALHNLVDDLATHDMLLVQVLILACVQMLPLARFNTES